MTPARGGAEEYGHIELVAATINTRLTGASDDSGKVPHDSGLSGLKDARIQQHAIAPRGLGALCADSQGKPWTGDYVFSSGDLVEDLTHNYFLETDARSGKLRMYEIAATRRRARSRLPARARRREVTAKVAEPESTIGKLADKVTP